MNEIACSNCSVGEPVSIGCRVQDSKTGDRGVVLFVGPVEGSSGVWVGVDWDEPSRGKHDGRHDGVRYFSASTETSGSFLRPGKLLTGVDVETAVRDKYQAPPPDSTPVEHMLQSAINARFVQFVGMEHTSKKQSALQTLKLVELKECLVSHAGPCSLSSLLPRVTDLNLSACLLPHWQAVACIAKQLPKLRMLDVSENRLAFVDDPEELKESFVGVHHVILNRMLPRHSWQQLLQCAAMFTDLTSLQVAYNNLSELGPVPPGALALLENLDVGANPISDWAELMHLAHLPSLMELNVNNCQIPCVELEGETADDSRPPFASLTNLYIANNPLEKWRTVCQLASLPALTTLAIGFKIQAEDYFPEFTFAIIRGLTMLNRTSASRKEKRDFEVFYLNSFSKEYYEAGGTEDPSLADLAPDFVKSHPTYFELVKEHGAPPDGRLKSEFKTRRGNLKGQKISLTIVTQDNRTSELTVLPAILVARLKMMLKRHLKLAASAHPTITFVALKEGKTFDIPLDVEHRELSFYSLEDGATLRVSW